VDSQTASASEIFAAALIDNERAICMGTTTVGKNVAQVYLYLNNIYICIPMYLYIYICIHVYKCKLY
jgi:C-terminal processing protease CtpA/Prc